MNPFVDIALTIFDSSFNSYLFVTSFSLLSKPVFFIKLAILFLFAKLTFFSLILFSTAVRAGVVANLLMIGIMVLMIDIMR